MPGVHAATSQWIGAGTALAVAFGMVWLLRALFTRRARRLAESVLRGELTPQSETRLRLVERLVYAVVLTVGVAIALSQFDAVRDIGRTLLASGAVAAAILGFAARQTLANVVAGVMIAITQPLRLGDHVAVDDHSGVVVDVTLSFTVLRTGGSQRVVIPNERIAASVLRNDSLGDIAVAVEASVWVAPDADPARAVAALEEVAPGGASVAEATPDGIRLSASGTPVAPADRPAAEAELRLRCLERLHAEGLLPERA